MKFRYSAIFIFLLSLFLKSALANNLNIAVDSCEAALRPDHYVAIDLNKIYVCQRNPRLQLHEVGLNFHSQPIASCLSQIAVVAANAVQTLMLSANNRPVPTQFLVSLIKTNLANLFADPDFHYTEGANNFMRSGFLWEFSVRYGLTVKPVSIWDSKNVFRNADELFTTKNRVRILGLAKDQAQYSVTVLGFDNITGELLALDPKINDKILRFQLIEKNELLFLKPSFGWAQDIQPLSPFWNGQQEVLVTGTFGLNIIE